MPRADSLVSRLSQALTQSGTGRLKTAATITALEMLSEPRFSQLIGRIAQARVPAPLLQAVIRVYSQQYGVDLSEVEQPLESFRTFDEFFTRTLRPGIHVVNQDDEVAVSPVDGRILNKGAVSEGRIDQVKGRSYSLAELLDSEQDAARFAHGHYMTVYLSPRDYHRIHCPVDGKITGYRYVPGRLYPVNNLGVSNVDRLFAVNERLITYMRSPLGEVAVVKVGATNVGMITASYHPVTTNIGRKTAYDERFRRTIPIARGGELGMFHLGSTVVVVAANEWLKPVDRAEDSYVRMGEPLFRLEDA